MSFFFIFVIKSILFDTEESKFGGKNSRHVSLAPSLFDSGKKKPQLILLDHGLYRELNFSTRINYAALWKVHLIFVFIDFDIHTHDLFP